MHSEHRLHQISRTDPAMPAPSILAGLLTDHARQRHERFVPTSFTDLFSSSSEFLELPDSFVDLLARHRPQVNALLEGWLFDIDRSAGHHPMVTFLAFNTQRFIRNNNQFLVLHQKNHEDLANLYRRFLRLFHEVVEPEDDSALQENLVRMLADHRENLREFIGSLDIPGIDSGSFATPACSEYSPPLQLGTLHLDPRDLRAPLLDIGCGEQAGLVRYLRMLGVESYGVDLFAPAGNDFFFRADWLASPLEKGRWGTVVSHMAFSHHFLHHHLKGNAAIVRYARRYMEILESLQPGGHFIYAPGLPFIEELLPRTKFRVERRAIPQARGTPIDAELTRLVGTSTFYSASIRRLPE